MNGVDDDDDEPEIEIIIDDPESDPDEPPMVAASEHDLIMMARALVQPHAHDVWAYFAGSRVMPETIGPTCDDLLADALGQLWPALWRRDGARPGASIIGNRVVRGRGWERHAPAPLVFTSATLAFLRWLVGTPLASGGNVPELVDTRSGTNSPGAGRDRRVLEEPVAPKPPSLAIGDQLVIYLALELADDSAPQLVIARQPLVRAAPLAWLGFAHLMEGVKDGPPPAFDSLVTGAGAIVVEALGLELADRWRRVEHTKRAFTDPHALFALGKAQTAALDGFMTACDAAHRRDLAGFVLDAAAQVFAVGFSPAPLTLDPSAPLSVRSSARAAAGALLRGVRRWAEWDDQHRGVRFIDDDYDAAQLLLRRFELVGRAGADRAAQWLADLASLVAQAPTPPTTPGPGSATIEAP